MYSSVIVMRLRSWNITPSASPTNYAASKAGLVGFVRSMARELGSRGITFDVVEPGLTSMFMSGDLSGQQRQNLVQQIPLARLVELVEVMAAVAFLAFSSAG